MVADVSCGFTIYEKKKSPGNGREHGVFISTSQRKGPCARVRAWIASSLRRRQFVLWEVKGVDYSRRGRLSYTTLIFSVTAQLNWLFFSPEM